MRLPLACNMNYLNWESFFSTTCRNTSQITAVANNCELSLVLNSAIIHICFFFKVSYRKTLCVLQNVLILSISQFSEQKNNTVLYHRITFSIRCLYKTGCIKTNKIRRSSGNSNGLFLVLDTLWHYIAHKRTGPHCVFGCCTSHLSSDLKWQER